MRPLVGLSAALAASILLSACGSWEADSADMDAAAQRASSMAAAKPQTAPETLAPEPTPSPTVVETEAREPIPDSPSSEVRPDDEEPSPEQDDQTSAEIDAYGQWAQYPWGSNGLECPEPVTSSGSSLQPNDPSLVVVMGDSLVRNARGEIESSLTAQGFTPVFVCWGGKNLEWGQAQVQTMRQLGVLPNCLVINLGTNDLKGTTAQNLTDAVGAETVATRLTSLLAGLTDVDDVFVVNIDADLSTAPQTMSRVQETRSVYRDAVSQTGVGAVIDWASMTDTGNLIGGDGIHDTDSGRYARAQLIADAVARDCG